MICLIVSDFAVYNGGMLLHCVELTRYAALLARDTGTSLLVARITDLVIPVPRDRRYAFRRLHCLRIAKLDLWRPDRTGYVYPIVVGCTLQWLARIDGPIHLFLLLPVELGSFAGLLNLQFLTLAVFLRHLLFVMRKFWELDKVVLCVLHRAQNTLILLPQS